MAVDPLMVASLVLSGGAVGGVGVFAARDYMRRRFIGIEDRYMALYGREAWSSNNMDLTFHFDPADDEAIKDAIRARLLTHLAQDEATLLNEQLVPADGPGLRFAPHDGDPMATLFAPRQGIFFDFNTPGSVNVIWNHMQTDGVGIWATLKPLFDDNPPLVPYRDVSTPPPVMPELLSLPRLARMTRWKAELPRLDSKTLHRRFEAFSAAPVRALKSDLNAPFNLVSSATVIDAVFNNHPDARRLTVGLTVYFPFLDGRNRYGILPVSVRRGDVAQIVRQLVRAARHPALIWGMASSISYALGRLPDEAFLKAVSRVRSRFDVLISNLPVGVDPVRLAGHRVSLSCHPRELTMPYYFLIVGTRDELNVSCTTHYDSFQLRRPTEQSGHLAQRA